MFKKLVLLTIFIAAGAVSAQAQAQKYDQLAKSAGLTQEQAAGMSLDEIAEAKRLAGGNANN